VRIGIASNGTPSLQFCRVNYSYPSGYSGTQQTGPDYYEVGDPFTFPALASGYVWKIQGDTSGNTYTPGQSITLSKSIVLTASKTQITARFIEEGVTHESQTGEPNANGEFTVTMPALSSNQLIWIDQDGNWIKTATDTITEDTTYTAVPKYYKVTLQNGSTVTEDNKVEYGTAYDLPDLPDNFIWVDSNNVCYEDTEFPVITSDITFTAQEGVAVTLVYLNGTNQIQLLNPGETVVLPNLTNTVWVDENGKQYSGGDTTAPIQTNTTFYERQTLTIRYDFASPASGLKVTPTLDGGSTTQLVGEGASVTIRGVTPRSVYKTGSQWSGPTHYYFDGWTLTSGGTTYTIPPNTVLTWEELQAYAGNNTTITLNDNWSQSTNTEYANFYIRLDSQAVDYGENVTDRKGDYSASIHTTYVGNGADKSFNITDQTPDNSRTADLEIRALMGERSEGVWIYDLPSDEEVLKYLRDNHTGKTTSQNVRFVDANGNVIETVSKEDLTTENYAVRWYVFKHVANPTCWHVDGRLVKKEGVIRIYKTFQGDEELVADAMKDFYVTAKYDDPNGTSKDRNVLLNMDGKNGGLAPASVNGNTYEWHIQQVGTKQEWEITEYIPDTSEENFAVYSEYTVYDSTGINEAILAQYGSEVAVTGVTQAVDESLQHMLRVDFGNFYLRKDAIALKKEDASTGLGLAGVSFEMYHVNMSAPLRFTGTPGNYEKDDNGSITKLITDENGYITVTGFSYDRDQVVFREVGTPNGYIKAPDITLQGSGKDDDLTVSIVKIGNVATENMEQEEIDAAAEYHDGQKVLVVKNYSVEESSVTVKKEWEVDGALWTDTVTVELYANGQLASNVIPGLYPVSVTLKKEEGYTYTWNELPVYVNGSKVQWSVKETAVGEEKRTVNGRFVNWLDTYDLPDEIYVDGNLVNTELVVHNDTYQTRLILLKTDSTGTTPLPDVQFRLQGMSDKSETVDPDGYDRVLTTDSKGRLTFYNLAAGYYKLTEVQPPVGYYAPLKSIYLYIDASGEVKLATYRNGWTTEALSGDVTYTGTFSIQVSNYKLEPLPETGGTGSIMYTQTGSLLMLAAIALLLYRKKYRKEEGYSP
jgi:LPXTG-motif cell wall-anchored protein